ncbi:MAG: hypothetical protein KAU50_05225 [Candidatus Marinimicrobia bacterium]|nr:hypothetical protein [Candidatus Neomarinimicrobiota bacterium]
MKQFMTLLIREVREWQTAIIIILSLSVLAMVGSSFALHKGARVLEDEGVTIRYGDDDDDDDYDEDSVYFGDIDDLDDEEWLSPKEWMHYGLDPFYLHKSNPHLVLFLWSHFLRSSISMLNAGLLLLALFYLADALYKERADRSTYFYRSQPVTDTALIGSKLLVGTAGIALLSWLLSLVWVAYAQATFPAEIEAMLTATGRSVAQIAVLDLMGDWFVFQLVQTIWLLPYALYLLLVSAAARSRPLLVAIAIPVLLVVLLRLLGGNAAIVALLFDNIPAVGDMLFEQWQGRIGDFAAPGKTLELFNSFSGYIISPRTLWSLAASAVLVVATWFAYRRNFVPS